MKVKYNTKLKFFINITILILFFTSCGINKKNYNYNEMYRLRPIENRFDTSNLKPIDYAKIDTNAIYIASDNWFYKFYSKNKLGFSRLEKDLSIEESLNPKRLKMGYFEIEKDKIITYILVNTGYQVALSKTTSQFYKDSIVNKEYYATYKRQELINYNHDLQPDW